MKALRNWWLKLCLKTAAKHSTPANIRKLIGEIMVKQAEIAAQLDEVTGTLQKVANESASLLQKINDLEAQIAQGDDVSPELQAAFDRVKAQAQVVDELVPDAEPTPPPENTGNNG